jgi:hypothetical protein
VAGLSPEQLRAHPIEGRWSIHEAVCHIADCETLYAERMKRIIAEHEPLLHSVDPSVVVPRLAISQRVVGEELQLVDLVRRQMAHILQTLSEKDFERIGIHATDGPLSLLALLERISAHVPHHVRFVEEKKRAMSAAAEPH